MVACIIGPRPKSVGWSYSYEAEEWLKLKARLKAIYTLYKVDTLWTGMALGTDHVGGVAALELQDEGVDIKLCCAVPCEGHTDVWITTPAEYKMLLDRAFEEVIVCNEPYSPKVMGKRNRYMIDRSSIVICVYYSDTRSGTLSGLQYAQKCGKPVVLLDVRDWSMKEVS